MKSLTVLSHEFPGNVLWLDGLPLLDDSNILITLNSMSSSKSMLITNKGVTEILAHQFVEPALEVPKENFKSRYLGLQKSLTVLGYSTAILLLLFSALTFNGAVKARIVLTGSMEPSISPGDIIITTPVTRKEPKIGDVVAYQAKRFNGENVAVFSHRIIGGDIQNGFVVKGDANESPDSQKPKAPDILGVVIFVIPFLGNILTPKALFLLVPCIFGLWLIMDAMKSVE